MFTMNQRILEAQIDAQQIVIALAPECVHNSAGVHIVLILALVLAIRHHVKLALIKVALHAFLVNLIVIPALVLHYALNAHQHIILIMECVYVLMALMIVELPVAHAI